MAITQKTIEEDIIIADSLQTQFEVHDEHVFPYTTKMSFHLLIKRWEELLESESLNESLIAKEVIKQLANAPELYEPIKDYSLLEKHKDLVKLMLSGLFPSLKDENYLGIVGQPFAHQFAHRSEAVMELMSSKGIQASFGETAAKMMRQKIIGGGITILNMFYGQNIEMDMAMMFALKDEKTGLDTYYKGNIDTTFVDVIQTRPLKKLPESVLKRLLSDIEDVDYWLEHIPANNFEFVGLVQVKLTDITEEQAQNNLKLSLLEKDAVVDPQKLQNLEHLLRTYLGTSDLALGLGGKAYGAGEEELGMEHGLWNLLVPMKNEYIDEVAPDSIYQKMIDKQKLVMTDDLRNKDRHSGYEKDLIKEGYRGLIIAPLKDEAGNMIGVIELGSKKVCGFHAIMAEKLRAILPVFTVAIQRAAEEKGNQVEVLIKQKYTSIHPSVEWRFIKAANQLVKRRLLNPDYDEPEPISFKDVYPFYGQSDIVGSSTKRNSAIQKDLVENLRLLKETLGPIDACMAFPLVGVYQYRVNTFIDNLKKHVNSGDEVRISEFLTEEINPLLDNLAKHMPEFKEAVKVYKSKLDPELGVVYTHRRAYEDSVTFLNETLSRLINQNQHQAQQVLPHYFEMYKTDGVEYNMYMGESMLNGKEFDIKYIENIRLWQLMTMIAVTRKVHEIQPKLKLPLKTAELILAFSNRIAIRFKTEEKQFDVDGAYNVRYEVIKKRIDKSKIKGTNERLTQAGKIAIVYTQEKERLEYLQFFDYLKAQKMIEEEVEELLIDDLQGVSGLRALRVKVIV